MTKTVSHFSQLQEIKTLNLQSWPLNFSFTVFLIFFSSNGCLSMFWTEWSRAIIMTIRSDGCTRRHMSVLCSSNVRLKLLLCVNKDDRKWQFGSSNQECHSQLHPLPASDTSHGQRGHGSDSSFSLFPFLPTFITVFAGLSISMPPICKAQPSRRRQHDVRKSRARATEAHFLNAPIKHEACLVRLS